MIVIIKKVPLPSNTDDCYHPVLHRWRTTKFIVARKEAPLLMQSSAAVAGRALIMLVCVIGIPAWALSGSSWSGMMTKLQDFRWPAILNPASASMSIAPGKAPRFAQSKPADMSAVGLKTHSPVVANTTLGALPPTMGVVSPAVAMQPSDTRLSTVIPVGYQTSEPVKMAVIPQPIQSEKASGLSADPFEAIPKRLRQLGATYYLLESWDSDQQMYRFCCKMAVGGSADYTRYFESSHGDPLEAMHHVLQQVEAWRGGGPIEDVGLRN